MLKIKILICIILVSIVLTAISCKSEKSTGDSEYDPDTYNPLLRSTSSQQEIDSYFKNAAKEYAKRYINYWYSHKTNNTVASSSSGSEDAATASSSQLQYSDTNVQEQGVDEADLVKTDGNYMYLVNSSYFIILKSWPATELKEIARVPMTGYPRELFLYKNKVIIFTNIWEYYGKTNAEFDSRSNNSVKVCIYDISDKTQPVLERDTYIEGNYITSRRIDNKVYILSNSQLFNVYKVINSVDEDIFIEKYISAVNQAIDLLTIEDFLPKISDTTYSGSDKTTQTINTYENFYVPTIANGMSTVHILAYDLNDTKGALQTTGIVAHNPDIYATKNTLYLANCNYEYWFYGENNHWRTQTSIHKFYLETTPQYIGSSTVDGYVLDQFSMSEYNNHLRIATTVREGTGWSWNSITTSNNLHILNDGTNSQLAITGKIANIAPGESLFSSRFLGDRGYLVTFERTDPLFTLDLSDPNNPEIKGELVMPGYSSYLHPIGENHLLGVGMNADADGRVDGFQISLFDVRDLTNPKRIANKVIGSGWNTYSSSLYDHHAFQYYAPLQLLAIPISHWSWGSNATSFFNGVLLLKVTETTIEDFGEVNHSDLYTPSDRYSWNWNRQIKRNLFIGDGADYYLYSISGVGVKANHIYNLSVSSGKVLLPNTWVDEYWYLD